LRTTKPRLLVLASTYPRWQGDHEPGFVHELTRRLCDDYDVTVLCPHAAGTKEQEVLNHVRVIRYRYAPRVFETLVNNGGIVANLKSNKLKWLLLPTFFLAQLWVLRRIIKEWHPDVIHAHWLIPQGLAVALLKKIGMNIPPFLVTSHGADLYSLKGSFFQRLKRMVAASASGMTVVSHAMEEEVVRVGLAAPFVRVQPMGVDLTDKFSLDSTEPRSNDEILFVGRLVEKKGANYLLDAMPDILRGCPDARLSIVGYGPEESNLRAQVEELGLSKSVTFFGALNQSDLPAFYRRAAVFVAPFVETNDGDQEGLGLVLVEALGCGCPVVVSDLPATRDVTVGINSLLAVTPKDAYALSDAVVKILRNEELYAESTKSAVSLIRKKFDWAERAKSYSNILKEIFLKSD